MARTGRPTTDPKGEILAVRVAARHKRLLERRAKSERITLSEALRRYLDELRGAPSLGGANRDDSERSKHRA